MKLNTIDNILFGLWCAVFAVHPLNAFYVFGLNIDKIVFLVFIGLAGLFYYKDIFRLLTIKPWIFYLSFVLLTFVINGFYTIFSPYNLLNYSFEYLALFLFSLLSYILLKKHSKSLHFFFYIGLLGLFVSSIYGIFFDKGYSMKAFFSNTNQLSRYGLYYSVLASIYFYKIKKIKNNYLLILILGFGFFFPIASVRRSAIIGVIILAFIIGFIDWKLVLKTSIFCSFLIIIFYFFSPYNVRQHEKKIFDRFVIDSPQDVPLFGERGYELVFQNPYYLIIGAGQGGLLRFKGRGLKFKKHTPIHIHSIPLLILFSYGILGLALLGAFYYSIFVDIGFSIVFLLPILPNLFFHNDFRSPLYQLIPIMFLVLYNEKKLTK